VKKTFLYFIIRAEKWQERQTGIRRLWGAIRYPQDDRKLQCCPRRRRPRAFKATAPAGMRVDMPSPVDTLSKRVRQMPGIVSADSL
jgi:hypothetical protein